MQSRTFDDVLIRIDYALFGVHPTVWLERVINPLFTALLQFAYISYYFIPVSLGVVLIAKGKHDEFEEALFGIVLCFYLSYIGYLLVPAVGPRFTLEHLQTTDLQAGPFIQKIQSTLNGFEHNKTDAFPSGHTAIALTTLYYAWKKKEKALGAVLVPVALGLIISTVYLRYHYVIDVLAGIALTVLTVYLAPKMNTWFSRPSRQSRDQRHHTP
jgi:membrane-associated phospholipid phosphatase